MPRAFLITHRRYNGPEEFQTPVRDYSPERGVRMAEYGGGQPTSDGVSDCGSETSSECPEELYNLTKLAEVSLAAAAGTLIHPSKVLTYERPLSPRWNDRTIDKYSVKHEMENSPRTSLQTLVSRDDFAPKDSSNDELSLRERTRLFFERIESEREILELRNHRSSNDDSKIRLSRESSSPSRSQSQNDICDVTIVKISSVSFNDEPTIEESTKSVLTTLTRKTNSSSLSSSEGSKSDDSEADHECPDCGKKYSTSSNLARHRQTHRSLGDKKARRCPHCDKIYVSMPAFSMHVRTHNQGCKCHYCGKCFSRPWLLQGHIRTHTGEKPFKCMICNKAFADKSNLRAHVQTHSNTKPHVCGRCGKAFALKSYLYKHEESSCMRAHNRGTSEKRETGNESCLNLAINSNPPTGRIFTPPITASPTSVIVQRPGASRETTNSTYDSSPLAFSSIIRHTNNETICREEISSPPVKRQCGNPIVDDKHESATTIDTGSKSTLLSRMVIRTSVISPNPEHLSRLGGSLNAKKPFDFNDPTRTSAFSKPTTINLNLAIA